MRQLVLHKAFVKKRFFKLSKKRMHVSFMVIFLFKGFRGTMERNRKELQEKHASIEIGEKKYKEDIFREKRRDSKTF